MSLLEGESRQRKDADRKIPIQSMFADIHNSTMPPSPSTVEFVESLREWFEGKGWLTDKQFDALKAAHKRVMNGEDALYGYEDDEDMNHDE
jgi:hypothetical protein